MRHPLALGLLAASFVLAGCASRVPTTIRTDEALGDIRVEQVQRAPERHTGRRVRWGGKILAMRNLPGDTDIEVLSRPLASNGRPVAGTDGGGRFIARVPGFVDPAEYLPDRLLTVIGTIVGVETGDIGDYPYHYPVVAVSGRYVWPERRVYDPPYGYPWGYGPYRYRPWYGHRYGPWYDPWDGPWYGPW